MDQYIKNLLPRLRQFGQTLNRIETFADKVWTVVDEQGNIRTYRFKRNKTLRVTINGNFTDYRWELEGVDAIAISSPNQTSGELYRHGFVLEGLLVLQKEGTGDLPTIFYDEAVVPNGDVNNYIRNQLITRMQLGRLREAREYLVQTADNEGVTVGTGVYNNDLEPVSDAVINIGEKLLYVKDGRIQKIVYLLRFQTDLETILIHSATTKPNIGDTAFDNGQVIADGEYIGKVGGESFRINVENGRILTIKEKNYGLVMLGSFVVIVLVVVVLVSVSRRNQANMTMESSASDSFSIETTTLVDTTALAVDSLSYTPSYVNSIPETPSEEKAMKLKSIAASYFSAINNRNWSEVSHLLNMNLTRYYGTNNVSYSDALVKLREYWQDDRRTGIIYEEYDMNVEPIENGYRITAPVVERGTEGFYRTPTWIKARLYLDINHSDHISGIHSSIEDKTYDFYRMFDMSETVTLPDYAQRNNTQDWNNLLGKIKSVGTNTPSEYNKYRQSILDVYGDNWYVVLNGTTYSLGDYMDLLARGEQTETYFFKISTEGGWKQLSRY